MRVLKGSLKRSLSLVLAFMLSISGVDIEALADTESVDTTRIDQTLGISATFFDTDVDKDDDGVCEYGEAYGLEATSSVTIPMSLGDTADFSDYALSNISSVILRSETDNIEVSLEEIQVEGTTLPLKDLMSDRLVLGYYSINYLNNFCNALFEKYLSKEGVSTLDKDAVKKSAEDFISNSKEYSLIINYDTGERTFSLDTEVHFVNYEYYNSHESNTSRTTITDLVYSTEVESGKVPEEYTKPIYGTGMEAGAIISVPTSKTIEDNTFYDVDSNSIFTVKEGDIYNTYYVDVESEDAINFPLKGMSTDTDVVNVKFDDNTVYDSVYSIKLNSTTNLDADSLGKKFYVKIKSPNIDNGEGVQLYSVDELLEILIDAGISRLQYEGEIYDLNGIDLSQFDSIADFLNNAQVPYISDICALDGSEYKGVDRDSAKGLLYWNFADLLSSDELLTSKIQGLISLKNTHIATDFSNIMSTPARGGVERLISGYYPAELHKNSSETKFGNLEPYTPTVDDSYFRRWYSEKDFDSFPLFTFYTYSDYELPEKYKDIYITTEDDYLLEPNFEKVTSDMLVLDKTDRIVKVPTYGSKTKSFLKGLYGYNGTFSICDSKYNWISNETTDINYSAVCDIDGYLYINFDYSSSNSISNKVLLDLLNRYYNCNFKVIDDLYDSDYFAGYSYKFEVPNSTSGLSNYKSKITSCYQNSKYYSYYLDNNTDCTEIYVPWYHIYCFMQREASKYMYSYFEDYGIKCKTWYANAYYDYSESDFLDDGDYSYRVLNTSNNLFITEQVIGKDNFSKLNYTNGYRGYNVLDNYNVNYNENKYISTSTDPCFISFGNLKDIASTTCDGYPMQGIRTIQYHKWCGVNASDTYWYAINSIIKNIKNSVKSLEAAGIEIDYENSYIPDINNLSYEPLSTFIELIPFKEAMKQYSSSKLVKSVSTNKIKKTNSVVTGGGVSISPDSYTAKAGDTSSVFMQVRSTIKDWGEHSDGKCLIKNTYLSDYVEAYDSDVLDSHIWLTDNTSFSEYEYKDITTSNIGTYIDYKFGNLIFASRPSVVQDLTIKDGKLTWTKSLDEGLGVSDDGASVTDEVVSLSTYTISIADKETGEEVYEKTIDFNEEETASFEVPEKYNKAGYVFSVFATNVVGDSDEVSITIPAKATPTPVPTATPTVKPTATPTKRPSNPNPPVVVITNTPEVTATPTVEPTSTPVPEYKLTVEDVYYDEDGTKEKSNERLTITVKEGEHYSYPSLDKDNYIARVSKFEGTVTSDVKLVFEYDKKKSKDLIVQGYVKKSDGTPVDNSLVEIVDEESKSDITDNTGFYRIEGVSEGEHDYTLYSGTTTGSSIVAKCKISVKDNNGEVKVTFKSEDSKIDTQTEEGVVRIDATLFDEEVTQSPAPTEVPTPEPTVEPTAIPSPVPTEVPTSEPTIEPTVIPTVVPTPVVTTRPAVTASPEPTVTPPSDMPTPLEPDEVETPKPTKKPIKNTDKVVGNSIYTPEPDNEVKEERVTLVQTGLYDNTKSVVGLILTSLGVCILFISLKKRNKK